MFVHILEPQPSKDRWQYWVVFFADEGLPVVHKTGIQQEAEAIAKQLAEKHGCTWKFLPNFEDPPHWYDEEGNLRAWDRLKLVHLGNGRGQLNTFSGSTRLFVETGDSSDWLKSFNGRPSCGMKGRDE